MWDICLKNGSVFIDNRFIIANIYINDQRIGFISKKSMQSDTVIDCTGKYILPSLCDMHIHCRDESLSYKEDFYSASASCIAGGITTICDMPNNKPYTDNIKAYKNRRNIAEKKCITDFHINLDFPLSDKISSPVITEDIKIFGELFLYKKSLEYIFEKYDSKNLSNKIFILHMEDRLSEDGEINAFKYIYNLIHRISKNKTDNPSLNIDNIPHRIYFAHVSQKTSLQFIEMIKTMHRNRIRFITEVTPHHIALSKNKIIRNSYLSRISTVRPPLRSKSDCKAILDSIKSGSIDILSSDHAPHLLKEKPENCGIASAQFMLPVVMTEFIKHKIPLEKFIKISSENPYRLLGLYPYKGKICKNAYADLVVISKGRYRLNDDNLFTKAGYTPYHNYMSIFKVDYTLKRGKILYDGEYISKKYGGKHVSRL